MSGLMSILRGKAREASDASDVANMPEVRASVQAAQKGSYSFDRIEAARRDAAGAARVVPANPEERYPGTSAQTRRATCLEADVLKIIHRYGYGGTMADYAARDIAHMIVYQEEA